MREETRRAHVAHYLICLSPRDHVIFVNFDRLQPLLAEHVSVIPHHVTTIITWQSLLSSSTHAAHRRLCTENTEEPYAQEAMQHSYPTWISSATTEGFRHSSTNETCGVCCVGHLP